MTKCPNCGVTHGPYDRCPPDDSEERTYPDHYPFPFDEGKTHWEDCWRYPGHHNCAVSRVYDLQDKLKEMSSD